jgi:hypothetical protein
MESGGGDVTERTMTGERMIHLEKGEEREA